MNDQPNGIARLTINLCGINAGLIVDRFDDTDSTGKAFFNFNTGDTCPVVISLTCASGAVPLIPDAIISPPRNHKRTINCGFTTPLPSSASWGSYADSLGMIHLDENPTYYSQAAAQAQSSSMDPNIEANRETVARSFLAQSDVLARKAEVIYNWLLETTPPNDTVYQNLLAGQSIESQVVYVAAGNDFFAASGSTNSGFVMAVYNRFLDRDPTTWELNYAVSELNGYSIFLEEECQQNCYWLESAYICDEPAPTPPCGQWVWYQRTRADFLWEIVSSHEHHQVLAELSYGIQLRRDATPSEVEAQAYHIGSYGIKEGAVRVLKTLEFYNKSINPW